MTSDAESPKRLGLMTPRGLLPCIAAAWSLCLGVPAIGAYHQQGNVTISVGGSAGYRDNENRGTKSLDPLVEDSNGEDYEDLDVSLYLSSGYFVLDRTELGLSGSALMSRYYNTDRSDFAEYGGDATGTEWKNEIYLGVTWYLSSRRDSP